MKYFPAADTLRRTGSALIALLLVLQVVAAPATASTTATTSGDGGLEPDCDITEWLVSTGLHTVGCPSDGYNETAHTLETHTDMYTHLDAQEAAAENYLTVVSNYREDLDGRAWMITEATVAQEYQNGSTATEAKAAARQEVASYYERKQLNFGDRWNTTILAIDYSYHRAQDNNVSNLYHHNFEGHSTGSHVNFESVDNVEYWRYVHREINTSNAGETQTVLAPQFNVTYTYDNTNSMGTTTDTTTHTVTPTERRQTASTYVDLEYIHTSVNPPTSDYPEFVYLFHSHYKAPYVGITEQENQTQNEISQFVDATYSDYETGELDADEIVSRITLMEEYGLKGADNNATFSDVTAALASMGLEHPNLAETGYMTVSYHAEDGQTYFTEEDGMLFTRSIPNGTWNTSGAQYNSSNITGPVMFANQDGTLTTINGTFTIHSAVDQDGNTVQEITTEDVDYQVANTTELQQLMNDTKDLQDNITVYVETNDGSTDGGAKAGFFGGLFDGLSLDQSGLVVVAALAGALLLAKDLLN